jgi:hypothetical protein
LATVEFLGFVVAAAWIMQMLPADMSTALTAWMLTSIPISIVIGHCALGEDKPCRGG